MFRPITLSILAICILFASGYVFWKNKEAYDTELVNLDRAKAALKVSQDRLETARKNLDDTENETEEEQNLITGLLDDEKALKETKDELTNVLRGKEQELSYFLDNPDTINGWRDKVRIAENSMGDIRELDGELKDLDNMIAERESNLDNLTAKDENLLQNIQDLKDHITSRSDGRSIEGLETKIRSIFPSWGFVTLADGDKAGVVLNSTLDVVRNDEVIAKLLVMRVERNTASADIVPGSMASDTSLMIGDTVVPAEAGLQGDDATGTAGSTDAAAAFAP